MRRPEVQRQPIRQPPALDALGGVNDRVQRLRVDLAVQLGLGVEGVTASPLPGPAGNVEYFVWLRRGAPPLDEDDLQRAIEEGPS